MSFPVAVIDIGSNSIKLLVATKRTDGTLEVLKSQTEETRISAGISKSKPVLSEKGMELGLAAIRKLLDESTKFSPDIVELVATSAVRDAINGAIFRREVREKTGHEIRILSGKDEANYIGMGLIADPSLHGLDDFYVFDLGGGSLECLSFRNRSVEQAVSLQLGCVRLTERCVPHPQNPLSYSQIEEVAHITRRAIRESGFRFNLPRNTAVIGTGGTVTTMRVIRGTKQSQTLAETIPIVPVTELRSLLAQIAPLSLVERQKLPGMPAARADVLPVALATLITLADLGSFSEFRHSLFNLRYGIAAKALAEG